jgi:hypothetical protein
MRWMRLKDVGGDIIGVWSVVNCIGSGATGAESESSIGE